MYHLTPTNPGFCPLPHLQMQHLIVNPAMLEASKDREREADAKLTSKQQQLAGSTCVGAQGQAGS